MQQSLVNVLTARRQAAGQNGRPLAWSKWGKELGVMYTSLFRFVKGQGALGIETLRTLAERARESEDTELLSALASYALGVTVEAIPQTNFNANEKEIKNVVSHHEA